MRAHTAGPAARLLIVAATLAIVLLVAGASAVAAVLPSGFQDSVVFSGLEQPTAFRFAPDGRVFVAEMQGKILVYDSISDPTPTVFADLRTQVYDQGDRGLLGLALDPEFATGRPYVYALYAFDHVLGEDEPGVFPRWGEPEDTGDDCPKPPDADVDACPVSGRIGRLTVNESDPDHAIEEGGAPLEHVLVEDWCQQNSSHSIGTLEFGPEGALFAGGGEGASFIYPDFGQTGWPNANQCGDPPGGIGTALEEPDAEGGSLRAQNPENLDGSIIRIDPDTGAGWPGNPLAASADENERRVVAIGMRNPYRFAIQPLTGEAFVGNVGNSDFEEIDRFDPSSGELYNSGWPCFEGPEREYQFKTLDLDVCNSLYEAEEEGQEPTALPFFDYNRHGWVTPEDGCPREEGSAISGLRFYDGGAFPAAYDGALFFADTVRGCIYAMKTDEGGEPDPQSIEPFLTDAAPYPGIDVEVGPEGDLYYTSLYGPGYTPGAVHRISYVPGSPIARLSADKEWGETPLAIQLDASDSEDPDGEPEPLSYEWDLEGNGSFEPGGAEETLELTTAVNRTVSVKVSDGASESVDQVTLYPGDSPPVPTIDSPDAETFEWQVGESVEFEGSAEDSEENDLSQAHLYWSTRLLHCPGGVGHCHAHPLQVFPGVDEGSFQAPDHDYPSSIELSLTATDDRGLSSSTTATLYPHEVDVPVKSVPVGVTVSAGLVTESTPFTLEAIEGSQVQLSAPKEVELDGVTYEWESWSDGGARTHVVLAGALPEGQGYTATYAGPPTASPEPGPPTIRPQALFTKPRLVLRRHPARRTHSRRARFVFRANRRGLRFRCKLDRRRFRRCQRRRVVYRHLKRGRHVFRAVAVGRGGHPRLRRVFRWRVL